MGKHHVFWDSVPKDADPYGPVFPTGGTMWLDDTVVKYLINDYDREDRRLYVYHGEFSLADYAQALQELQTKGVATLGSLGHGIQMALGQNNDVHLSISGCPGNTPGGTVVHGTMQTTVKLEYLLLDAVEKRGNT
jgi:hypothetical protein